MGLNGKQLLENFKEDEAYGNTTYTPPDDSSDDDNGDNAWKYISAGDISGLADYTNRNYNYRTIPFLGQIVGHAADAATQGVADAAQFVGAQGVGDYLNEKAQEGEAELPAMSTPELSLAYLTDPNGLASAFGMMAGSMLSTVPVAAIAPELLPARVAMALSKVPKALSAVPKIGGALEEMAPMAGRFALTGPVEAMMEGGNTEREMLQNGATPEEARQAAWNVFGENVGLLTATNALEGGLLGKIKIKTPHFSNPVVNTAGRVAGYVPTTAAEMALQGYEEGAQQGIQNGVEGESPNTANQILNPFAWTDDQWDAAKLGVAGAVPLMGAMGAIRHFGNRGDNGSTAADSLLDQAQDDIDSVTSQAAQQSVIQSAQQDMENNPYTAPTAMQDTSYEAPSDTSDTSSGSSYDASALEGDPQYTVSGEVSSTDVTPLTDQKMRLLDSAYYNKYGQHLYITSMKRNGNPDESWHNSGQAFDTADDNLENNKEARDWLISEGEKLGLTPLDEYEHPSAKATGGHIHFSDHGEPIPDGIRVGESDSDMDDNDTDDSTGGVDLSNLPVGDIAMAIAQNTNLPVNFIWSQLSHESDGGKSKLAVEDHNYGGVKGNDGEYLHFDNDQQFIDYMSDYYPKYREDGIYDAKTADQFAEALQHGGYFTADLGEYEGGMHRYLEQAGLSQDAMSSGKARRAGSKGGDNTSSTPDLSGSFEISADDPAMDSMFASFAKDWQNMSTDANEINFFGDMFNSRNKFKATEENKQAILDNYGDAFRQYVQENQPQTVQAAQTTQAPAQPKQAPQPQRIEMQTPNLDKAKTQQNAQQPTQSAQMPTVPQESPRKTVNNLATTRLNNMLSEIPGDSFKKLDHIQKLAYLMTARSYANAVGSAQANNHIDSIISKVRRAAGFNGDGVTDGMNNAQKNAFYQSYTQQAYDAALDLRRNATDDTPTNLQKLDNAIQFLQQEVKKNSAPAKAAKTSTPAPRTAQTAAQAPKQTAGKADKYKKDAEKIYLRFKSGKFSTDDSIKQLNNLKKKATSDKALSDEDRADVITEADKHIDRIKPQKETKKHETQKYSSKTAETAQSGKAKEHPHQDAEPEKGRTDAEESEVKASSHFDTSDFKHTKTGEMIPAAKISSKVDADTYKAINSIAKKHGGYYNRYAKRFLFNKGGADGRDAFVEEAERSVFNGADSGTKENNPPVSAGVKRYKNAIDKIKKQYDDGEIDIGEYDNRFFALGDKWLRDAHLTDEDKKEVAAYSDKIDAAVEAEETRREKTRYDFIKKAAKSYAATKPRETKVTGSGNQILNDDTVDAVLKAQGDGVPSNLADYVRGVTREDVASIPDKRKKFIDEAIDTGAFRAIETDRGGYMLIGTKGGMFSSVTELTPAETVYYAMHGGLDFNKRSTKEAIMDDLATWYGSEKSREIKSSKANHNNEKGKNLDSTEEQEESDATSDIQNANAASTDERSVETIPHEQKKGTKNLSPTISSDDKAYHQSLTKLNELSDQIDKAQNEDELPVKEQIDAAHKIYTNSDYVIDAREDETLRRYADEIKSELEKKKSSLEKKEAASEKNSIFGSVEDADREMLDALGLSEDDLTDDVLTAPDGIENTAEEREKLEKELAAELNKLSANPVFNPKIYTLGLKLAMTYVKDGINTVKKLVAKFNATFGDKIGPWAPALAETVRTWPKGVPFDEKKVMAISKAVGARYEGGITTLNDMQADMKKLLKGQYKSFAPMIEASYNGIKKFFDEKEAQSHGDESRQEKSESTDAGREGQQSATAEGAGSGRTESRNVSGAEGGESKISRGRDSGSAERENPERTEPSGVRAGTELEETAGNGTRKRGTEKPVLTEAQKNPSPEETPGHDYEIKPSKTKKTPAVRFKQNIAAIKLLKQLEAENRMPTPKEQAVLGNYNGWGGLKDAFLDTKENKELRAVLTPEEYEAAKSTINDAFYTPADIVQAVWKGVSRLGFNGGRVLDPSMGTGNFFGCMPRDMMKKSSLRGIEIDDLTSRFARMLYPSALVERTGFEKASLADNFYDLVISNIPFDANHSIAGYKIHNYFFAHGMDKVRPGGLMVYITSQGSLTNSQDGARMREYIGKKADMVAAYKLPSGAFGESGTNVGTDIVIFRKRGENEMKPSYAQDFQHLTKMFTQTNWRGDTYGGVTVNKYFKDHPENIIGKASSGRDQYGNDVMQVKPNEGANIAKDLAKAMNKLPKDIYKPVNRTGKGPFDTIKANFKARADEKTRDFEYYEKDGKVYQNQDGTAVEVGAGNKLKRLKGYLKVKNALNSLMLAEMDPNAKESTVDKLRKQLNTAYDAFVKQNGYLNDPTVQRAYIDDPSAGMVMALEKVEYTGIGAKKKIKSVEKMGIFNERAIAPIQEVKSVKTPNDALIVSLRNKGGIDLPYMAQLMGSNPETVVAGLEGQIFKNPVTEAYETRDEYLSGNVREKLAQAENAAAQDPSYQRNVDELKKVIPKDLIADEICVTMGAPWIPASDVQAFADRITGRAGMLSIKFISSGAKWIVDGYGSNSKYKTQGISLANLLSDILNNKAIEVYSGKGKERRLDQAATDAANVVAADMKEDFTSWLWSDKDRTKRLTRYYNDNYNNTVLREYDGSHLVFDGMNEKIKLRPHQKNVVWRMLQGGNTLIAHCVGAGKTFEMQAAGMEMRRLGIANKPLYILPNNVVEQFTKEFRQLYPDAKLLVLQNDYKSRPGYIPAVPKSTVEQTIKREDGRKETITIPFGKLSAADRKKVLEARAMRTRTLTQIRTGDWDGIIMSHSQFERLPLSPETAGSIIREQLDEVEQAIVEAKNGNVGKKDLSTIENQKKKLEDKLKDILKTDLRDIGIPFEQLGVDQIFVDEADMFKNLHYTTSMDRVNGLPNSNANRSMDMYAKTRWLTNANNGRGVVFATGTPVSNTMAEMYTMMRYLDFRGLKEKGLNLFDNWLRTFGEIGSGIERNPSGNGFRKVTKVLRFINMPELTKMFRKFADVKTQDDLDLDIPDLKNGKPTIVKIAPDPVHTDYIRNVVPKRIATMAKRREDMHKGSDNMLKLTGDLRKMSITDSKIDALADAVAEKYEDTSDVKGAQLIFCDQGIPKAEKDNATDNLVEEDDKDAEADNAGVYKKIITALQERGIPENQIVFIQSAKNKAQMDAIFEKVDKGDIRILIGSTQKMGAGTNCQHHLVALHDLDAPWRPRDLEQRHGRILRQGNPNKEVEIFNYVLQDSFDAVMWEKLKNKAAIVAQAMSNNMQQRTVEDADLVTLTYADAENAGTSDPLVKERITLDSEIKKYKHAQVAFNRKVSTAEATLETAPKEIGLLKSAIEKIKGDIAARQDTSGDNFRMTISGKEYVERKAAQEELGKVLAKLSSKTSVKIGEISGFDVKAYVSGDGEAHIQLVRGRAYMANTATVRGIESALHKAPETMLKAREIELSRNENNLKEAKEIVGQKNPYAEKLAAVEKRFKEINRQIEDNLLGNAKKEETEAPNEETSYSAEEESGAQERALSDIKQEVASAFPNAKNIHDNGHEVLFSMPNGAEVSVNIVPSIEVTESEESNARAAHGLSPEVHIKISGKERTVGSKAIIELSQLGKKGTTYHEAFHAVYDMCLTDKEKAALHKAYDKEAKAQGRDTYEVMADKYRDWMIAKQKGQHTLYGKLWQKVKDAAARLARVVRGADDAGDVFRKVASGEAWERPYNEVESDTRYAAEQKGAQSFIKAAASKLGKRMGVKSDKIITEEAKAKEGIGILDYLIASPSRVATRVKSFRQFYRMGVRAMDVLTERRSYYQRKLGKAMQLVKSKNDYEELTDILLSGDAEGKEWTKEELIQSGTKENVAEAYTRIRHLMRQAYKMVNEAHKHPKTYSKRLSNSKIEELRQNPFVKIMKIHDEEDDGRHLVTYREFANYEHTLEGVTKQALDEMRVDEDMQVLKATKQADGTYKVRVREGRGDVTNRKGYIPHFFHNYMVEVRDEDGNYVTTITSGRTQREAVKKAEEWMKDNKLEDGQKIYIHPKIFDFTRYGMSEKGIVQLGDKDFYALMNRVAKDNDMSFEEAKDLLQNVHQKNRHRFFGNVLHRKGVSGFETDMNYVLSHYFNSASRYYAMETEFKPQAISLYERLFGDFAKDSKNSLAQYVKDYINDVNGTPAALERGFNEALMRSRAYRYFIVSHYGERAVLQLSSNIAGATTYMCLGYFNVSSALLNLTQVMNSAAYIGDVSALGKCLSKGMHRKYSLHDLKVLKETNVLNDIGLDSGSGYDVNRMSAKNLLGKINKAGMSIFKVSEQTVRIGTVLAAYESGIKRGMSHEEAIDFAKEVNQKSNFDYSVADAPNIFRRGSFLAQLALQFKKYGIKELEVMADMLSPRTSRKQKLIFWGTYLLAAGLCGLPALDWLDPLLAWVTGTKSPKLAVQAAIMEAAGGTPMGKFIGRMAMYGLPSSLVGVDLSSRVGMSDVVPTELKNLLPPLATKIPQFMQDIFSEAKINAIRDFSPAIYNQIAAWGTGKSYDKRGRINAEYNTFYDKLLRSIGFKSTDERVDSDIRRITSERRSELTKKKQEAVDAYIAHPTPQNMQKLKDLGIKDSTVKKERERKNEDSYNRTKGGMTKKEAQENQQLLNFK